MITVKIVLRLCLMNLLLHGKPLHDIYSSNWARIIVPRALCAEIVVEFLVVDLVSAMRSPKASNVSGEKKIQRKISSVAVLSRDSQATVLSTDSVAFFSVCTVSDILLTIQNSDFWMFFALFDERKRDSILRYVKNIF